MLMLMLMLMLMCVWSEVQVFLLTDGEVSNTNAVISLCDSEHQATGARVFTFGIGGEVSHALIQGVAKVSGGDSETVVSSEDAMEPKVRDGGRWTVVLAPGVSECRRVSRV